jgi:hypothetical protein
MSETVLRREYRLLYTRSLFGTSTQLYHRLRVTTRPTVPNQPVASHQAISKDEPLFASGFLARFARGHCCYTRTESERTTQPKQDERDAMELVPDPFGNRVS